MWMALPLGAQERFGGLAGTVTDSTKAAVPGATITVTNAATGTVRTVVSGSDGGYRVPDLVPGRYNVVVELQGFQKVEVDEVLVLLGKDFLIDVELQPGAVTETVNVTGQIEKQIDLRSVTIAHNVTAEEFDRLPKTRTFQGLALASPGVNSGDVEGGLQVNGASGAENSYTIDGVTTNSLIYGSSRQDTIFEYLQEVQVKTAAVDAQYGGALGGVISAVTKSGGNTYHGEAHYFYIGSGLSAGPVPRIQLSPIDNQTLFDDLQDTKQPLHQNEFGGSIGGPIVKDRLFFFGSISPRIYRSSRDYLFDNGVDPGTIHSDRTYTQAFGKVTYSNAKIQANIGLLATPVRDTGVLAGYDGLGPNFRVSSEASNEPLKTQGWEQDQYNLSGDLNYWLGSSNFLTFKGGYFYDSYKDTGIPNITSYTYQRTSVGAANVPLALQGPIGTQNTPRTIINEYDTTKQGYFDVNYNHAFAARGTHVLKGGAGYRRGSNDVQVAYPGGYTYIYWNTVFPSPFLGPATGTYGYYRVDDFGTFGKAAGDIWTMFVQDTWSPTPRLTLNLGLRTEYETIPTFRPDIQENGIEFSFGEKMAPRLGASYDVRGDGRMKLYGSWGRYYDWTKYEIARGLFGGDVWHIYYRSLDTLDIGSLNLDNLPGTNLWPSTDGFRDLRGTHINDVDPNLKPMFQDSTNVGWEYQVNTGTVVGVHYIHNSLGRTIEDFSALIDGNNLYAIGNPGEGFATIYPAAYPNTPDFAMPKARRVYDALELTASRRFSRNWFASASYVYSSLRGNYAGLANSDEISAPTTGVSSGTAQQQGGSIARPGSNVTIAWDTDTYLFDSFGRFVDGPLATDRPHVFKLYGAYQFDTGTQVGAFLYAGSGTPVSTLVNSLDLYPLFVNNRGDMGRTPALSRTNLLVSHELRMMGDRRLRLELQILNVFNQKTATHIFNFLNKGAPGGSRTVPADAIDMSEVNLFAGYDYNALLLQSADGAAAYDPRYGLPDLWQTGTQGQFMVKFIF
jgi:hypothetical protein